MGAQGWCRGNQLGGHSLVTRWPCGPQAAPLHPPFAGGLTCRGVPSPPHSSLGRGAPSATPAPATQTQVTLQPLRALRTELRPQSRPPGPWPGATQRARTPASRSVSRRTSGTPGPGPKPHVHLGAGRPSRQHGRATVHPRWWQLVERPPERLRRCRRPGGRGAGVAAAAGPPGASLGRSAIFCDNEDRTSPAAGARGRQLRPATRGDPCVAAPSLRRAAAASRKHTPERTIKSKRRRFCVSRGTKKVLATAPKRGGPDRKWVQGGGRPPGTPPWPAEHEAVCGLVP